MILGGGGLADPPTHHQTHPPTCRYPEGGGHRAILDEKKFHFSLYMILEHTYVRQCW